MEFYKQNIDVQLIIQQEGYRSLNAVRKYKTIISECTTSYCYPLGNPKRFKTSECITFSQKTT